VGAPVQRAAVTSAPGGSPCALQQRSVPLGGGEVSLAHTIAPLHCSRLYHTLSLGVSIGCCSRTRCVDNRGGRDAHTAAVDGMDV
jgi:hypothetical protein